MNDDTAQATQPKLSKLQEFLSPVRALWDPKTFWTLAIAAAAGAVLGYSMFQSAASGAAFVLSIVGLTYVGRTLGWPQINVGEFSKRALETSEGAARVLAALIIWCAVISLAMISRAQAEPISGAAVVYLPTVNQAIDKHWPQSLGSRPPRVLIAGLIDHETACPREGTCWQPTATYKTKREEGVGFGMFTRAFNANGTLRFDALTELKALHPTALRDANWQRNKYNPELQATALVLKVRDNYETAETLTPLLTEQPAFAITMHNRGVAGVQNDAAQCRLTRGCDARRWKGHVERTCAASKAIIPGTGRSACDISRAYYPDIVRRSEKYARVTA